MKVSPKFLPMDALRPSVDKQVERHFSRIVSRDEQNLSNISWAWYSFIICRNLQIRSLLCLTRSPQDSCDGSDSVRTQQIAEQTIPVAILLMHGSCTQKFSWKLFAHVTVSSMCHNIALLFQPLLPFYDTTLGTPCIYMHICIHMFLVACTYVYT